MEHIEEVRKAAHVAALAAGDDVYIYWGSDLETVRERVALGQFGMIATNLDTSVTWLKPDHFPETYERIRLAVGYEQIHFIGH